MAEHPNCQAVEAFLNKISRVSVPIGNTQNLNDKPVLNAYVAAWHEEAMGMGFTVVCFDIGVEPAQQGIFKVYTEFHGNRGDAERFGEALLRAVD